MMELATEGKAAQITWLEDVPHAKTQNMLRLSRALYHAPRENDEWRMIAAAIYEDLPDESYIGPAFVEMYKEVRI